MPFSLTGLISGVSSAVNQDVKAATSVAADAISAITHPASIENAIVQNISNATASTETALAASAKNAIATVTNLISSRPTTSANVIAANTLGSTPISAPPIINSSMSIPAWSIPSSLANLSSVGNNYFSAPNSNQNATAPAQAAGITAAPDPTVNSVDATSAQSNIDSTLPLDPKSISNVDLSGLITTALKNPAVTAGLGVAAGAGAAMLGQAVLGGSSVAKSTTKKHHTKKHHKAKKHAHKSHKHHRRA